MENKNMINIVLDFLNQMEIYKVLSALESGFYIILRKNLITEFENDDIDKLFEILTSFDELYIDYLYYIIYYTIIILILYYYI